MGRSWDTDSISVASLPQPGSPYVKRPILPPQAATDRQRKRFTDCTVKQPQFPDPIRGIREICAISGFLFRIRVEASCAKSAAARVREA